jgi:two-component system, probable response regulator PhcQ
MDNFYDYKQFAILYVDDEEKSLKYFERAFQDEFRILTAPNVQQGLQILDAHKDEIGVLMTDQRMPGEKGVSLLEKTRQLRPRIVRMLVTAYADLDAVVSAVNTGAIYRYVTKPWDPPQLESTLKRALEFFIVQRERDQLLNEKMSVLHNMMMADHVMSLGLLSAGMSHHIRNALVAVKTFLDLVPAKLQEELGNHQPPKDPDFWTDYYQNVQGQVQKIQCLLDDLWNAAEKPTADLAEQISLRSVIDEVAQKLKSEFENRGIRLDNRVSDTLPTLQVDKGKIHRLFHLLLKDEVVSLPAGSQVSVSAQTVAAQSGSGQEIQVQIHDNGPGLPEDALRTIFDPFVARSDSPSEYGINLMASYLLVHHLGGKITVKSGEGHGTAFRIRLRTDPSQPPLVEEESAFSQKVVLNETLWQKLQGPE